MNLRAESVSAVEEWLEGIPSKNTRKNYRNGIKQFEAWYGYKEEDSSLISLEAGRIC